MVEYLVVNSSLARQCSFPVTLDLLCMDQGREHVKMIKHGMELSLFVIMEVSFLRLRLQLVPDSFP
jgi:hypothetical protein